MPSDNDAIDRVLKDQPRVKLIKAPTIIHRLDNISQKVGFDLYVLREDLTGFALGGNKTRKVEFLLGDAIAKKADVLVTKKATSFSRNAAAAARACGLEMHVVLVGDQKEQNPASQDFFNTQDTNLHYVSEGGDHRFSEVYDSLIRTLMDQGKKVYELHPGGSDCIGALGYVEVFNHIVRHSLKNDLHFDNIVHSVGSWGTQAGMLVGRLISEYHTNFIGIAAALESELLKNNIIDLASNIADMLGVEYSLDLLKEGLMVDDSFIGPGYSIPSKEGENAARVFSSLEGILLDYAYTGKAAAALLDYAEKNRLKGKNALFIHTGGNQGLYY